jgi:hypothetical protein
MRFPRPILILAILMAAVLSASAQEAPEELPKVIQHAEPTYPPIARTAHIQGEVGVRITTDGESVREAEAETGPALLRKAAEVNARTWKFAAHTPGTFHVTFRYKLMSGDVGVTFLESPATVEIQAAVQPMSINWAWIDLGKWKAQLKSPHGNSGQVFELRFSGPNNEWLDGEALGPKGESEEIDFGYFGYKKETEGTLLGFTVELSQPDGQHVRTFLIGKMTGDKIVGTFVDDSGIRGEWAAVRVLPE